MGRQFKGVSRLVPGLIASGLVLLLLFAQIWAPIERKVNNQVIRWYGAHGWDSRLVMISIDDKTISQARQFPISRDYYAQLLKVLSKTDEGKPNTVAFNLILSDNIVSDSPPPGGLPPSREPSTNVEESDISQIVGSSATERMSEAMRQHGYAVLGKIWDAEGTAIELAPTLSEAAIAIGHLRLPFDPDGFTRSVEVFYQDIPTLGMAAVQVYSLDHLIAHFPANLKNFQINWPGPVSDLTTFSLVDVLSGAVSPDFFSDKIVFVSYGATGGHTSMRSPFDYRRPIPGGYLHLAVADNLLNLDWLRPTPLQIVVPLLLLGGPILSRLLLLWNWPAQLAITAVAASSWLAICVLALKMGYLLPMVSPTAVILGTYLFVVIWRRLQSNALLQVRSVFLNTMSHEIRTPLNAIVNLSEMLKETPLDDRQREYAETLYGSSQTLVALINDVLDLSKIEAGHLPIGDYPVNIVETIERSIELLAPRAAAKNVELVYAIAPNVPAVIRNDPVRLQQILSNLLSNAVKFTAVGEVSVRVRASPCRRSRRHTFWERLLTRVGTNLPEWLTTHQLHANRTARTRSDLGLYELCFEVKDTGTGILPAQIPYLFRPFSQGSVSTTQRYGGTGLGLSICQRLIKRMGGDIWAESTLRKGSQFFFSFKAQIAQATLPPPNYLMGLRSTRLLVVDANSTRREQLARTLQTIGIRTLLAESLIEARASVDNTLTLDGLILDETVVSIAGVSDAIDDLQSLSGDRQLPVIVMSALKSNLATALGDVVILWKPIKQSALYQALRTIRPPVLKAAPKTLLSRPAALLSRATLKILIADDNRTNQLVALRLLEILGYRADVVSTGTEVLAMLKHQRYDVILMDMRMPEMNGVEVTQKIRQMPHHQETWIIAMTANALTEDRELCLSAGMNDYIHKPIKRDTLALALERSPALQQLALD